ncbi:Lrp/AsnC ligand binding domain-containing protein [Chitinispirillales bacterium ANBcel5]|uniref:Lrp/AsnC family transcriptional regulator n=1 Tax=Cellulosispirillum alkaliphilum TaxID=3039283 RepID=UPI002A53D912|nr:Lrp/AsnC ligand binding domain-containing protein [Chitinispirillales bacterium ANBcel5]
MITAIILLKVKQDKVNEVASKLAAIDGVREAYSVAGKYDITAIVWVKNTEQLSDLVTEKILKVDGILESETQLAFRAYSKYDLDRTFSL